MYYTNAVMAGDEILLIEMNKGKRNFVRVKDFKPYLFIPSSDPMSEYKTVYGKSVSRVDFSGIKDAKDYVQKYSNVAGHTIFGLQQFQYTFIHDRYPKEIKYNVDDLSIVVIDIETDSKDGFPDIETANKEILTITLRKRGRNLVFGMVHFVPQPDTTYIYCKDEEELLKSFLHFWNTPEWFPDVITGWNIEFFDIPYLVNRIKALLGMQFAKLLSPWKYLRPKKIELGFRTYNTYELVGINSLDYLQLYRKFSYTPQESYTLDFISEQELKEKKVDWHEAGYESLSDLYEKNPQLFLEYNIQDCALVEKLDNKLRFVELVFAMAYDAKINFADALTTVRMWDVIIHNHLLEKNMVIPPMSDGMERDRAIQGAYVKDPLKGRHKWVASFDFESLYPTLIEQHNISPETYAGKTRMVYQQILGDDFADIKKKIKENDWALTGSGCYFLKSPQGFLPELMTRLKAKRKAYKKKMFDAEKRMETDESAEGDFARYNAAQQAVKIQINAAYGALANPYYRWFQPDLAESITLSGQMTTQWVEKYMNKWMNKVCGTEDIDYVIAVDTDSCYFNLERVVNKMNPQSTAEAIKIMDSFCANFMQPAINEACKELAKLTNVKASVLNMKRECLADVGIWTAKKHYILNVHNKEGVAYEHPKAKLMGIEAIKSSIPIACRKTIKEAINIVLEDDQEKLLDYVAKFRKEFFDMPFEAIAFPRGCNGINKYANSDTVFDKGTPIHVRSAIVFNYWLIKNKLSNKIPLITDGEKIKFAYMLEPNPFNSHSIANLNKLPKAEEYRKYVDYEKQFDKCFLTPLRSITDAINWELERGSTFTLDDFFN